MLASIHAVQESEPESELQKTVLEYLNNHPHMTTKSVSSC